MSMYYMIFALRFCIFFNNFIYIPLIIFYIIFAWNAYFFEYILIYRTIYTIELKHKDGISLNINEYEILTVTVLSTNEYSSERIVLLHWSHCFATCSLTRIAAIIKRFMRFCLILFLIIFITRFENFFAIV
jgi:hypothetical protein